MTLSQTRSIVETRMAIAGKSIMEHNEILGLDAAMKYINATLVNRYVLNLCLAWNHQKYFYTLLHHLNLFPNI